MSSIALGSSGFVYVLVSASLGGDSDVGIVKIGCTTRTPEERAAQLSASTAAPTPFHVAYSQRARDVTTAEQQVHAILAPYRVNESREFFAVPLALAIQAVQRVCGYQMWLPATPFAELFATFPDDGEGRELTVEEQQRCRELEWRLGRQ